MKTTGVAVTSGGSPPKPGIGQTRRPSLKTRLFRERYVYVLLLPGALYFLLFKFIPMFGLVIAFQDYSPFLGFTGSEWVGFSQFTRMFADQEVTRVIWNTLYISFIQIAIAFPAPIVLAVMLNEVAHQRFKRIIQSIVYLPHFISWVVVISIATIFLQSDGLINRALGYFDLPWVSFLTDSKWFVPILITELVWKETGWGTIIFLAALAGVNYEQIEAAVIDGANRWRRIWHITLPSIRNVIVILLILRLGSVLDAGFEQIFLMLNPFNMEVGNVLDTYVYFKGIQQGDFSFGTAVGLLKSLVGMLLVFGANKLAKRVGEEGLF